MKPKKTAKTIVSTSDNNITIISLFSSTNELLAQKQLPAGYNYKTWLTYFTDMWVKAYRLDNLEIEDRR